MKLSVIKPFSCFAQLLYSPGHDFGMVLFGSGETGNAISDQSPQRCNNVSTVRTLSKIDLSFFRDIETFTPEEEPVKDGSIVDALEVSMDMLERFCGNKKYRKRLFMITDGEKDLGEVAERRIKALVNHMKDRDVRLNVITLDFGNELAQEESEEDEETESPNGAAAAKACGNETAVQTRNKKFLLSLTEQIKGAIFPANVAMEVCRQFKKREVLPRAKYRGNFDLSKDL